MVYDGRSGGRSGGAEAGGDRSGERTSKFWAKSYRLNVFNLVFLLRNNFLVIVFTFLISLS